MSPSPPPWAGLIVTAFRLALRFADGWRERAEGERGLEGAFRGARTAPARG